MVQKKYWVAFIAAVLGINVLLASTLSDGKGPRGYGQPLPGLTPQQFELFELGRNDFLEVEEADEGLGPMFNARSCAECHNIPAVGGSGIITEMRAGRRYEGGPYEDLPGGSVYQLFSIPPHTCQEALPLDANIVTQRKSTPLFGSGLIEAIPDDTLAALEDPDDRDGDGISGRVHWVLDVASNKIRAGRFGWKSQQATLLSFAAEAYLEEMGITSDLFRQDRAPYGDLALLRQCDFVADPEDHPNPETGLRGIDNFANFLRFLAPPPTANGSSAGDDGARFFQDLRCGGCHVPQLKTGPNPVSALDRKDVFLYSDLLLHDVGTGDGIVQGQAHGEEIRTSPLWGLNARGPFLHDGSAADIRAAILRHAGEATRSREGFANLGASEQEALLRFLRGL